ncbi:MAG: MazG nucleotide pyrophosphohydrolase domain-containing protein, partial [Candidatus Thorarchaeota archaeon]
VVNIREAQEMMKRIYYERDKARGIERTILRTYQELGELSDAVLRGEDQSAIVSEMADVFAWVCSVANLLGVDLGDALLSKYANVCSRCGKSPCECVDTP